MKKVLMIKLAIFLLKEIAKRTENDIDDKVLMYLIELLKAFEIKNK